MRQIEEGIKPLDNSDLFKFFVVVLACCALLILQFLFFAF
jgi:hypothetical protein